MPSTPPEDGPALRGRAPWRVLEGFGGSTRAACRFVAVRSREELTAALAQAREEGLSVTFRGAGRSYGDASLNSSGLVIDTQGFDRLIRWEPESGTFEAEPGMTVEGLWRRTIEDGYWPAVVPGTMRPTLAGCVAMNIHGKNNVKAGTFGEHLLELDLLTASGETLTCGPERNPDLFRAVLGGLGLLGAVTRVKLRLKRIESGRLEVEALAGRSLDEMLDLFESRLPGNDYVVGWVDAFGRGRSVGRGAIHAARYLHADEDPEARASLHVERQGLPGTILGVPKSALWRLMRPFNRPAGVALINALKYRSSRLQHGAVYRESHVAFAFLLDYVPNWRLAYGSGGLIQYQVFVPHDGVRESLGDVLRICQQEGVVPYLGVLKRHRPDGFLLSHALDGWSLALDFQVTEAGRARLWALTERLTERVLAAGGRFYLAKDSVLRPGDLRRAYGDERVERFLTLKRELDPEGLFTSDLWARTLPR